MSLKIDITKRFLGFTLEVAFEAGAETLGFLGASGCGKSLTLRCIAGIDTPDEGYIAVNDQVFFDSSRRVNLKPQQRKTALLFQNYMLFPNLTAAQNIAAGIPKGISAGERDALVSAELKRFSLEGLEKRYPAQLSGGQQQRVALARMLAARPGILMLDEPFSALDSHLKSLLEQNLANLFDAYDGTILYVSHDIDEALHFCDRIAVVEDGRIREIDTGDELINHPQSRAGIRLSGCKNNPECVWRGPHAVFVPRWGVTLETADEAPRDVIGVGVRAFFLQRATGPGVNCFRVMVERVSDARFDRTAYLRFLDRAGEAPAEGAHARKGDKPDEGVHNGKRKDFAEDTRNHKGGESAEDTRNHKGGESAEGVEDFHTMKEHLTWRVDKLQVPAAELPSPGDELWIRIPPDKLYLVTR